MIEQFNAMTNKQKLELLYEAEAYIDAISPEAEKYARLVVEKEKTLQTAKEHLADIGSIKVAACLFLILSAVLAVLWLIFPDGLLKLLAKFCLLPSVLAIIISLCMILVNKKAYRAKAARLNELKTLIAASDKEIEAVKQQYINEYSIWYTFCQECSSPRDIRTFIHYFESGRANTLKEAKNLFAQERYQDQLNKLTLEQIDAAKAARRAADRAANAAQSAAAAASSAKISSDRTWWEVKRNS